MSEVPLYGDAVVPRRRGRQGRASPGGRASLVPATHTHTHTCIYTHINTHKHTHTHTNTYGTIATWLWQSCMLHTTLPHQGHPVWWIDSGVNIGGNQLRGAVVPVVESIWGCTIGVVPRRNMGPVPRFRGWQGRASPGGHASQEPARQSASTSVCERVCELERARVRVCVRERCR